MYKDLTLKELRTRYPHIKARTKKDFLDMISIQDGGIETQRLLMKIREQFPASILEAMYKHTGCECPIEAFTYFMEDDFDIEYELYKRIVDAYNKIFRPRRQYHSCCQSVRKSTLNALRKYYEMKSGNDYV